MPRWSVDVIRHRAERLGTVEADNEKEAIRQAAKTFDIPPERRNRIVVARIGSPRRTSVAKKSLATFILGAASSMGGCDDSVACVAAGADRLRPIVDRDDTDGCVARDRPHPNDLQRAAI